MPLPGEQHPVGGIAGAGPVPGHDAHAVGFKGHTATAVPHGMAVQDVDCGIGLNFPCRETALGRGRHIAGIEASASMHGNGSWPFADQRLGSRSWRPGKR